MTQAFVLGNGVSRQAIDLVRLKPHGRIYGCNALYREFVPDVLVATDRPIATTIQESGYARVNQFYTRRPLPDFGALTVPKPYFGFSSGPIAAAIAAEQGNMMIYLLGFDMGPVEGKKFNNLYAGTEFYKAKDSQPTFTGNWIKQIIRVTQDYDVANFIRVHGPTTAAVPQFDTVGNLKSMPMSEFLHMFQ
jgi:hypothetical protein